MKKNSSSTKDQKLSYSIDLLRAFNDTFQGIDYWLIDGSALKAYRDKQFVKSTDIDLAFWQSDIKKVINRCEKLKKLGFKLVYQNFLLYVEDHIIIVPPKKSNCEFELISLHFFSCHKDEAVMRNFSHPFRNSFLSIRLFALLKKIFSSSKKSFITHGSYLFILKKIFFKFVFIIYESIGKSYWIVTPRFYFHSLSTIKVHNIEFKIPANIKDYLFFRYGKDWKKPKKNWNLNDCNNVRIRQLSELSRPNGHFVNPEFFSYECRKCRDVFDFSDEKVKSISDF